MFEFRVLSELCFGEVFDLLDRRSDIVPAPVGCSRWILDGDVEVRAQGFVLAHHPSALTLSGQDGIGPTTIDLVRTMLRHGGLGRLAGQDNTWRLPEFDFAVQVGGADAVTFLGMPSRSQLAATASTGDVLGWAVAANVVDEHLCGEDLQVRRGLKHFAPAAKVWVSDAWNGDGGDRRWVVGRHRRSHRFIRIIIEQRHLGNARAKPVYSPNLVRLLDRVPARIVFDSRAEAERIAGWLNGSRLDAVLDAPPWSCIVEDPPPMRLEVQGTVFYLAHFNHRRARYSHHRPPIEP